MTRPRHTGTERLRQQFGRAAYHGVVAGLAAGIFLYVLRQHAASVFVLASICGLMIVLPVVNVLAVLVDEVRRRDLGFALLAAAVLGLLAYTLAVHL
jgi:hypothetical protein